MVLFDNPPTCMYCWGAVEKIPYAQNEDGQVEQAGRGERPVYRHQAGIRTGCTHPNLKEFEVEFGDEG